MKYEYPVLCCGAELSAVANHVACHLAKRTQGLRPSQRLLQVANKNFLTFCNELEEQQDTQHGQERTRSPLPLIY